MPRLHPKLHARAAQQSRGEGRKRKSAKDDKRDLHKKRKKPKIIVKQKQLKNSKDYKCKSIQKAFKLKNRKNLTPYDCSIMLTGGPLISDDGYLYFLPRLLEHVLEDPIHEELLNSRLKRLDTRNLSSDETAIIEKIKILADEIRAYSDMLKTKNC